MRHSDSMRSLAASFGSLAVFWIFVAAANGADPPPLEVKLHKNGDAVAVEQESGRTVIRVTSETGIGRMTISARDGHWPADVTLRLRYRDDKPFKTLEGFQATSSRLQIRSGSGQSGKVPFFLAGDDGKYLRDDVNPSGWLNVTFTSRDRDMDIAFPANLWRGEKEVQVQWIDFYR